jgi:glycosyltransferase involved in cell wall biosynthesis
MNQTPQEAMSAAKEPRISIVTPSLNQGTFLRRAMKSVLDQGYPDLEYVIIDGGSTDDSLEVIREHADRLTYWVSRPDGGQYEAINEGFAHTSGDIMAWLNADDMYLPWTFSLVAELFARFPEIEWLTSLFPLIWDRDDRAVSCQQLDGFNRHEFLCGAYLMGPGWYAKYFLQQEATFWRRSLWQRAGGGLDPSVALAGDFELWARFFEHAAAYGVEAPLAGFRLHGDQKSVRDRKGYIEEALATLVRYGGRVPARLESYVRVRLVSRIPGRLRPFAFRAGLLKPYRICRFKGLEKGWIVIET